VWVGIGAWDDLGCFVSIINFSSMFRLRSRVLAIGRDVNDDLERGSLGSILTDR
jgi:hypothetical protein